MKVIKVRNLDVNIDDDDFDRVNYFKWRPIESRGITYIVKNIKTPNGRRMHHLHRFILGLNPLNPKRVDHVDGNSLNNCKSNLRIATQSQNSKNRSKHRKGSSSIYKGVFWKESTKKWLAAIGFNYKFIYLGYFDSQEKAANAYNKKAIKLHGCFARLNKIATLT